MTTPATTVRPAAHVTEEIPGTIVGDLWAASGPVVTTERIAEGVLVHPGHGSATGTWPLPCTGAPPPGSNKDGTRTPATWFPPTVVWAADECSTVGNDTARTSSLAGATIDHDARYRLEQHYMAHVLAMPATAADDAPTGRLETVTAPSVPDIHPLVLTLAAVEHAMRRWGHLGVVHASDLLLPVMERLSMIRHSDGNVLTTPSGNTWAFGSGYDSLDVDTLIGTGPTTVFLDELSGYVDTDPHQNRVYALQEYIAVVTHTDYAIRGVSA